VIDKKRYARIASLDLSYSRITSLKDIEFPGSLTSLDLSHNQISSLKGIKFPARLETLYLSHNQISSLKGVELPRELRHLYVEGNRMSDLDGFIFPAYLNHLHVDEALDSIIPRAVKQKVQRGELNLKIYNRQKKQMENPSYTFHFA
jgi:Leucine-rich repeat (LRR) protein